MGLGNVIGVFLVCLVLSGIICIICRSAFKESNKVVAVLTWITVALIPTLAVVMVWYGILLIIGKVSI